MWWRYGRDELGGGGGWALHVRKTTVIWLWVGRRCCGEEVL